LLASLGVVRFGVRGELAALQNARRRKIALLDNAEFIFARQLADFKGIAILHNIEMVRCVFRRFLWSAVAEVA
jgi:hypothetical protein